MCLLCTDDLSFGFKPYITATKPVSVSAKVTPMLKALLTACGFNSHDVKVKGRSAIMFRMGDGEAASRLLSVSSQLSYVNPLRVIRVWDTPKLMGSSSEDVRQLKYFDPMKATDAQIYAAAESMLTLSERTDPTGVLPAYMLRHRLADQMVRTSDLRIKSIVEVELLSPVSMCDIFVVPVVVKNFGYSVTTSHHIVARYSYSIRHKTQTNMPRLTERFDDLKPGAVVPVDQIAKQFQLADVSPPRGPRVPRPRRHASARPTPPPNPAHLAQQAGGVVPRDELTKGKEVCMMFVSGGVNYAYAGVVCAPPHGVRVRVRFRDGAILLCKLDRMLAIVS